MDDQELLAFVRGGGNFGGGRTKVQPRRQERQQQRRVGGPGGQTGGQNSGNRRYNDRQPPPRDRKDIRCINCGGEGHSWRACPKPEVPRDQRPCLTCGEKGHISANCPRNKGSAAIMESAANQPQRTYEIRCLEGDGGHVRQRGKAFVHKLDSENFQVVKGGYIPRPSGARVESFIKPSDSNFRVTSTRNRFTPLTSDRINNNMGKTTTNRFQVRPESVVDLPPGTDDGRSGVPGAKPQHTTGTGTPSRNSVDRGRFNALEAAMLELDKREAQASNTPLAGTEAADTHTHAQNCHAPNQ